MNDFFWYALEAGIFIFVVYQMHDLHKAKDKIIDTYQEVVGYLKTMVSISETYIKKLEEKIKNIEKQ